MNLFDVSYIQKLFQLFEHVVQNSFHAFINLTPFISTNLDGYKVITDNFLSWHKNALM